MTSSGSCRAASASSSPDSTMGRRGTRTGGGGRTPWRTRSPRSSRLRLPLLACLRRLLARRSGLLERLEGLLRLVREAPVLSRDVLQLLRVLHEAVGAPALVDQLLRLLGELVEVHAGLLSLPVGAANAILTRRSQSVGMPHRDCAPIPMPPCRGRIDHE